MADSKLCKNLTPSTAHEQRRVHTISTAEGDALLLERHIEVQIEGKDEYYLQLI